MASTIQRYGYRLYSRNTIKRLVFKVPRLLSTNTVNKPLKLAILLTGGRRGGLMVSALDSGASASGSSPGQGHCVVLLGKTLYSQGASLHPGV